MGVRTTCARPIRPARALVVVASSAHRVANGSEDPERQPDYDHEDTKSPEDRNAGEKPNQEQHQSERNHDAPTQLMAPNNATRPANATNSAPPSGAIEIWTFADLPMKLSPCSIPNQRSGTAEAKSGLVVNSTLRFAATFVTAGKKGAWLHTRPIPVIADHKVGTTGTGNKIQRVGSYVVASRRRTLE